MVNNNELRSLHVRMYAALLRLDKSVKSNDIVEADKWNKNFSDLFDLARKFLPTGKNPSDDPLLNRFDHARNCFMMSLIDISKEIESLTKMGKSHLIPMYESNRKQSLERGINLVLEIRSMLKGHI